LQRLQAGLAHGATDVIDPVGLRDGTGIDRLHGRKSLQQPRAASVSENARIISV
jgi:hypothetical protein